MLKVWNMETAYEGDICVNYLRTELCEFIPVKIFRVYFSCYLISGLQHQRRITPGSPSEETQ